MHRVAQGWLVSEMANPTVKVGALDLAGHLPVLLLGSFAGAMMEGRDLRRLISVTQTLSMLQAAVLAVLTLTGTVQYWHILILVLLIGFSDAFEIPARQAFVSRLIDDPKDLGKGIAMTMSVFNVTRLVGPSLAGFVINRVGLGICFALNTMSYTGTLVALSLLRFTKPQSFVSPQNNSESKPARLNVVRNMKEGLTYVRGFLPIRNCLLGMALVSFFGFPYMSYVPLFARSILHGDSQTLGFLMSAQGIGALCASIRLATRKHPVGLARTMGMAVIGFGAALFCFSFSRYLPLSLALMSALGYCTSTLLISCNTTIQILVDDNKRSRIMSLQIIAASGFTPLGSFLTGNIARFVPLPTALTCWGVACSIVGLWLLYIYPRMAELSRPVFERKGILAKEESARHGG